MERPKLRYAYNEALINTYAEELEKYCDELEKALDKACEVIMDINDCVNTVAIKYAHCPFDKSKCKYFENGKCLSKYRENWKEWLMKDE